MKFIQEAPIYQSKKVYVYINQCHNPGRKTKLFAIRRDDQHARSELLGIIKFDGAWRQYVFEPEPEPKTKWCANCLESISTFIREQNTKWRKRKKKR